MLSGSLLFGVDQKDHETRLENYAAASTAYLKKYKNYNKTLILLRAPKCPVF